MTMGIRMNMSTKFLKDNNGIIDVWTTVLISLFGVIVIYLFTYDVVCTRIYNMALQLFPSGTNGEAFFVLSLIRPTFNLVFWITIIGIFVWAYTSSQRREYETGY